MATATPRADQPLPGILCLVAGIVVFSLQDVIIKAINHGYSVNQIVFARCLVALPLLLVVVHFEGGLATLRTPRLGLCITRGLIMFTSYTCYYLALAGLPLAETVAVSMSSPLFITALSVPFLGEHVGWRRTLAVLAGFAGVLLVTRPGAGAFNPAVLFVLMGAFCYALAQMLARRLGSTESSSVISVYASLSYAIAAALLGLTLGGGQFAGSGYASVDFLLRPWVWPPLWDCVLMGATGAIAAAGTYLLAQAYRIAPPSMVAPFEYSALLWAFLWGFVFWGELPDRWSIAGMALIVGAGVFIFYRETVRRRGTLRDVAIEA